MEGRCPQNTEQCFVTMANVAALLEREKAKEHKERFYSRIPPYPIRLLSKLYPDKYEPPTFSQYDSKREAPLSTLASL